MEIKQINRTNFDVRFSKREQDFLFISDVHYDSVKCDRVKLKKHLDEAVKINAPVFIFGDWFDLMQGKYDPRGTYSDLRPEYKSITYLDDVIEDSYEFFKKYSEVVKFLGRGNHETNIEKRLHTSPLDRLGQLLRHHGADVKVGGYAGWIKFSHLRADKKTIRDSSLLHYHHGFGGNARRSKGVLDGSQFCQASVIVRGHTHQKWYVPVTTDRVNSRLLPVQHTAHHLRLGSYKMLGDRFSGWATEKGFMTPRLGGWFAKSKVNGKTDLQEWEFKEAN